MKNILMFLFICSLILAQSPDGPLEIEIHPEVIAQNKVRVTVKIKNKTNYPIERLEGFITEFNTEGKKVSENRVVVIGPLDPALNRGLLKAGTKTFIHNPEEFHQYTFQVGTLKFSGDYRVYTWHPLTGFIRVD